jgi:hypothetical protein
METFLDSDDSVCPPSLAPRRVPAVYPSGRLLAFLAFLALRRMNNLRAFNDYAGFDSHPGHQFIFFILN